MAAANQHVSHLWPVSLSRKTRIGGKIWNLQPSHLKKKDFIRMNVSLTSDFKEPFSSLSLSEVDRQTDGFSASSG